MRRLPAALSVLALGSGLLLGGAHPALASRASVSTSGHARAVDHDPRGDEHVNPAAQRRFPHARGQGDLVRTTYTVQRRHLRIEWHLARVTRHRTTFDTDVSSTMLMGRHHHRELIIGADWFGRGTPRVDANVNLTELCEGRPVPAGVDTRRDVIWVRYPLSCLPPGRVLVGGGEFTYVSSTVDTGRYSVISRDRADADWRLVLR